MTLEGAINLSEANDYIVYTMNSATTGQYGIVVPKNIVGTLNMLVDLHMKSSFDGVSNGSKTKEQLVSEITEEYNKLKTKYTDGMLVMPVIDEGGFQTIVNTGDKQKMFDEVKKIGAITSELYKKLTEQGVDKQKIDQKIIIVEKSVEDEKFVNWLKEQSNMANFVDGFKYSELNPVQEVVNPFIGGDSIFGPAPVQQQVVTPVLEQTVSIPVMPVENVVPAAQPTVNQTSNIGVDLFSNTTMGQNTSVASTPVQSTPVQPAPVPVAVEQQPVVEGPKPVDAAMLEGTIAFTPIPNHPNNQVDGVPTNGQEVVENPKNNKGFANLLIIVVILIGVTIASIELGKYLYSVYGA